MWGPNQTPSGPPIEGSKREFRVVERVAYAHPVRDHHVYYSKGGGSEQQQRPPPPLPPHNNTSGGVGYPYYGGNAPSHPQHNSGRARVRREHNSECVLYDPAESVVVSIKIFMKLRIHYFIIFATQGLYFYTGIGVVRGRLPPPRDSTP